ncbi:MAG: DUF1294 domain-containing protein [Symbiobacteriia bacterium]
MMPRWNAVSPVLSLYIMIANVVAFAVMGLDKRFAQNGGRRVPERTLWILALIGGAPGAWAGMRLFHHKTRHDSFRLGFPLLALVEAVAYLYLL